MSIYRQLLVAVLVPVTLILIDLAGAFGLLLGAGLIALIVKTAPKPEAKLPDSPLKDLPPHEIPVLDWRHRLRGGENRVAMTLVFDGCCRPQAARPRSWLRSWPFRLALLASIGCLLYILLAK